MIKESEVRDMIAGGENSRVVFLQDSLNEEELSKHIAAFSNANGGSVMLGVDKDGTVSGVARRNLESWVNETCWSTVQPGICPYFTYLKDFEPGKDIAVVGVLSGVSLNFARYGGANVYFCRFGPKSCELRPDELYSRLRQQSYPRAIERPVSGTTMSDLCFRRLENYFDIVREQEAPVHDDLARWNELLNSIGLMEDQAATLVGLLAFGKDPNRFLRQAGIRATSFAGKYRDSEVKDRIDIRGPMVKLMNANKEVTDFGLVERAIAFVNQNTGADCTDPEQSGGAMRAYPECAVKEALVNAIVHRDYLYSTSCIDLSIYSDRLEILSPGPLLPEMTIEKMIWGMGSYRNDPLKLVMDLYRYTRNKRCGVRMDIVDGMNKHNGTEPEFVEGEWSFLVRLRR